MNLNHTVVLSISKDRYDTTNEKWERMKWLFNNVGRSFETWASTLNDSQYDKLTIEYRFKNRGDAVLFALRWS